MSKLNRVTGKIFGATASPTGDDPEIGQFGSAKAGTYVGTSDIATIQNLPAWSSGWIDAVTPSNQYPPLPERTGVDKVLSYQECYLLQQGIAEWDSATDYYKNCFCSKNGNIYISITDNNINNNPENDTDNWKIFSPGEDFADRDLQNLTTLGNSRLQFAPFAINQGAVENGENATLVNSGGVTPIQVDWASPNNLTSNGTWGTSDFALISSPNPTHNGDVYKLFDNQRVAWVGVGSIINIDINIPDTVLPTEITCTNFHDMWVTAGATGFQVFGSNDYSSWTSLGSASLPLSNGAKASVLPNTATYYQYLRIQVYASNLNGYQATLQNITITGKQSFTYATGVVCNPCTITTCDGRTQIFTSATNYDVTDETDGDYSIFKDYTDGSLSLTDSLKISKTNPSGYLYNITETGTLTKNNGIVSGFSTSNYGTGTVNPLNAIASASSFEFVAGFTTGADISTYQTVLRQGVSKQALGYNAIGINVYNGKITYTYSYNSSNQGKSGTYSIQANTSYIIKITFDGSSVNGYYSTDGGETFTLDVTTSTSTKLTTSTRPFTVGVSNESSVEYPFSGSIDLSKSYIKIDGEYFWKGAEFIAPNWLDCSTTPANLKIYDNGSYTINNDLVYIGDCTVESGAITALTNRYFNACPYYRDLVYSYKNGSSWCAVYSDNWCEQGGEIIANSSVQTISLLKPYVDKYYTLTMALRGNINDSWYPSSASLGEYISPSASGHYSNSQFQFYGAVSRLSTNWQASGYIR